MGSGTKLMQKKKTAETQIQQELSSDSSMLTRNSTAWMSAREPMTGAQASVLRRLAEELREPKAFEAGLSRSQAARRIHRLEEKVRLGELPPHTD
jgi:hypothetical protein